MAAPSAHEEPYGVTTGVVDTYMALAEHVARRLRDEDPVIGHEWSAWAALRDTDVPEQCRGLYDLFGSIDDLLDQDSPWCEGVYDKAAGNGIHVLDDAARGAAADLLSR